MKPIETSWVKILHRQQKYEFGSPVFRSSNSAKFVNFAKRNFRIESTAIYSLSILHTFAVVSAEYSLAQIFPVGLKTHLKYCPLALHLPKEHAIPV
jgi:hypothetical protein